MIAKDCLKSTLFATLVLAAFLAMCAASEGRALSEVEPAKTHYSTATQPVPEGLTASDWASVRTAYQAHRHDVVPTATGYKTRNPGQRWLTEFDGHGFITQPDAGGWQWGLELKSYGFAGQKRGLSQRAPVTAEGGRVTYQRSAGLKEWFVNDPRGLEHGFTVEQSPGEADQRGVELEFDLEVRGNLRAETASQKDGLRFIDEGGGSVVTYSGLKAWDAAGQKLPARFVVEPDRVRLLVAVAGARYPITVDPVAQQAYLKASNTEESDSFGFAVAISGDTLAVAATFEDSSATGVAGDQNNNGSIESGAVYIFVRNGTTWSQQAYLKASNTGVRDNFGWTLALSGDILIVGAPMEDSNATGVNGDQNNNNAEDAGAAYIFVRNGTTWSQQAYLKASNTDAQDNFGYAVSVSGETAVVGAPQEDSSATGINADLSDNGTLFSGAVYVFVRNGATWSQQASCKASNTGMLDEFGYAISISGDTLVVGAFSEDSSASGINGNQADDSANGAGAAYVFVRKGANWSQQAYLKASNSGADDFFGISVSISGESLVVGAVQEGSSAKGVNGDQTNNLLPRSGAAYVFVRDGATWTQQAYLKASNPDILDYFGATLALSGDILIVGASFEASNATGINGDQSDNTVTSGAAYLFVRAGTTWSQRAYLKASNQQPYIGFAGGSVAVSGETAVIGAAGESSKATGVNGDQSDRSAPGAGAAYVFTDLASVPPPSLLNISTRMQVLTGDQVLIGGFIINGTDPKTVVLRAIGPSLTDFGVTGALADPVLELRALDGSVIATNDNWNTDRAAIEATGLQPSKDLESAIVATLDPGAYTAIVSGKNGITGVGLVEAYDLDPAAASELANISTRGFVATGSNVMIGGFILGSDTNVLIRAIGPSLTDFGVAGVLEDPTLELRDVQGTLVSSNNNWRVPNETEIEATGLQPGKDAESALLETLPAGAYTAIVAGVGGTAGVALVEVYRLP